MSGCPRCAISRRPPAGRTGSTGGAGSAAGGRCPPAGRELCLLAKAPPPYPPRGRAASAATSGRRRGTGRRVRPPPPRGLIDDEQAADVLVALGVRAIGDDELPVLDADHGRRVRCMEAAVEDPRASRLGLLDKLSDTAHHT